MKRFFQFVLSVLLLFGMVLSWAIREADADEVMVIANPSVPAESLDPEAIKNIFLGKTAKWDNNDMVTIVVSESAVVHQEFLKKYIKRTENQFTNVWRQNLFTGKGTQPVKVKTIEELVEYVSKNTGAIGYISSDVALPSSVKVLAK
jgi:ABC-type phosphate transport system substrate-binding protein